jgi:type I restriction enzyme R subunit
MTLSGYSEDRLIQAPTVELFGKLKWDTADCMGEFDSGKSTLGRESKGDVVLVKKLRPALRKLNPDLPEEAISLAIEEITRDRSVMSPVAANKEIYEALKTVVKVSCRSQEAQEEETYTVNVVDWQTPANNDFFLASQFWVAGDMYTRRADLVGFVNGLPLVFIELKAAHRNLEEAYRGNLRDYRTAIPKLFWYNAFNVLSNGIDSRIGTITSDWEHFAEWKKINSEGEEGIISLETIIRGVCDKEKLLDLVENFTLFVEAKGGPVKMLAKNHQYLGVNNAVQALTQIKEKKGRLGVFWHTQGSGKSYSMVFFSQKVLRKKPGNWTFLVVTDRKELDTQIYRNFASAGAVTEQEAQATSGAHLKQLLREDHRFVFTLIQKFGTDGGAAFPVLSERSDIIVITDEAHRSQYDTLALNMRTALPQAAFIAFTGTPLIVGEEKTKDVFGDYVSVYNFRQSVIDGSTVPLYYENRIPELQLTNQHLNEDMETLLEATDLDENQQRRLEQEFSREYHLITREDRLKRIAEDVVEHFTGRGFQGKAMVISIDKATAVKMYDRVKTRWPIHLAKLRQELQSTQDAEQKADLERRITFMQTTDMAVVVSQGQNEVEDLKAKGVDITPHRYRMVHEDLETKFKTSEDPLRLVFVCAMWMTGFDVPSCSTIYLDKPMRNHTLMQTIARANRVCGEKLNGLIVDYAGVFRSLQKALAIYGTGVGGTATQGDMPVQAKQELIEGLRHHVALTVDLCESKGVDLSKIITSTAFERVKQMEDARETMIADDQTKKQFLASATSIHRLFKAILPDPAAKELSPQCSAIVRLADSIRSLAGPVDISEVMQDVEELLDDSVASAGYVIRDRGPEKRIDLSKIDFEALQKKFAAGYKRTEIERLKALLQGRLVVLVQKNRTRMDFLERFQKMMDEYNAGAVNIDEFFKQLVAFSRQLDDEDKRGITQNLSEEELAVFDLLTKPEPKLTKKAEVEVKKVAKQLLEKLKAEKLVLDWRKRQQSRAAVRLCIEEVLDQLPQDLYPKPVYAKKCDLAYQHIYEAYYGSGASIYQTA